VRREMRIVEFPLFVSEPTASRTHGVALPWIG
jgi:hypothetical protein